jgi:hypothetical protein
MELSPSSKAANSAATQELPSVLRNPKVHYRVHKSPPYTGQIDLVHTTHPIFLTFILILSIHLRLDLPSGPFPSDSPRQYSICISLRPHSRYMLCQSNSP